MKSCPTCNRTFEDTFTFCLIDGSILSAPFDPQATLTIPATDPAIAPRAKKEENRALTPSTVPPTMASPQPDRSREDPSTIDAPSPAFVLPEERTAPPDIRRSRVPLILITGGVLVLLAVFVVVNLYKTRDTAEKHSEAASEFISNSNFAAAEAEYRKALNLEPNNPRWYYWLGSLLRQQKNFSEAEAVLRRGLQLPPNIGASIGRSDELQFLLAEVFEDKGELAGAESAFREAIRMANAIEIGKHARPMYHWRLGMVLEKQKRYAEAEAEYREALRLQPGDETFQGYLDRLLKRQGK